MMLSNVFLLEKQKESEPSEDVFGGDALISKHCYQNKFTDKFNKIEIQLANPFTDPFINN